MKTVATYLVKPNHYKSLCEFADRNSALAKNLYNAALFRIRQTFTGWKKTSWSSNEREVFWSLPTQKSHIRPSSLSSACHTRRSTRS